MAEHVLSILVKAVGAQRAARDLKGVQQATSNLGRNVDRIAKRTGAFSGFVNRNLSRAVDNLGVSLVRGVGQGLEEMATLEDASTSVAAAINQVGPGWTTTADQIVAAANRIESETDAAFDDKAIVGATETLIRYGKVSEKNLEPAMEVMTDLAARTGDVDSAATLLAKALADPEKAAGKLARQGIILTKQQQDQIKAMVKAGDVAGAQALLLTELEKTTKGAAKASAGPYRDALNKLGDAGEDLRRGFVTGLAPAILEVSDLLTDELAKPETMTMLTGLGKELGSGLKGLIGIGKALPWDSIGQSLKIAGTGAKAVMDAFLGLPPWIQTAVLTGWGLNKISGGLIGDLASGLIKGVLGMNAGVVNINAGVVNGGGGIPGVGGKGGGRFGGLGGTVLGLTGIGTAAIIAQEVHNAIAPKGKTLTDNLQWPFGPANTPKILPEIFGGNGLLGGTSGPAEPARGGDRPSPGNPRIFQKSLNLKPVTAAQMATTNAVKNAQSVATRENSAQKTELGNVKSMVGIQGRQQQALQRTQLVAQAANTLMDGVHAAGQAVRDASQTAAVYAIGSQISAAVFAARPIIQPTTIIERHSTIERTGGTSGSRKSARRAD